MCSVSLLLVRRSVCELHETWDFSCVLCIRPWVIPNVLAMSQATVAFQKGKRKIAQRLHAVRALTSLTRPCLPGGVSTSTGEEAAPPGPEAVTGD